MAIALSEFEALCGFRPLDEIMNFINIYPEFSNIINIDVKGQHVSLQSLFTRMIKQTPSNGQILSSTCILENLRALVDRTKTSNINKTEVESLFLRIYEMFPDDIGCLCVFFLNYHRLQPNEALIIKPGILHAYISGDCIECMATSDNVVRAGLTSKFCDVDTLLSILDFSEYPKDSYTQQCSKPVFQPDYLESDRNSTQINFMEHTYMYLTPFKEFAVYRIYLSVNDTEKINQLKQPSILIVLSGQGNIKYNSINCDLARGDIYYIFPNVDYIISCRQTDLSIFIAFTP